MCGIFATLQTGDDQQTIKELVIGLKKLEYRGYDSWGIAYLANNQLNSYKQLGNLENQQKLTKKKINSKVAVGHTRWATHGKVNLRNTHPHLDKKHRFAVVHNGVIENFQELKRQLIKDNYHFQSDTDTEIIVALISMILDQKQTQIKLSYIQQVQKKLHGRNTFAIISKNGSLFASKNGLSLFLAKDAKENYFLSSDLISLPNSCRYFYRFLDGELMAINQKSIKIVGSRRNEKKIAWRKFEIKEEKHKQENFNSAMLKEIYQQKYLLTDLWEQFDKKKLIKIKKIISKNKKIFFIGAGSAFYVADYLSHQFRQKQYFALSIESGEIDTYLNHIDKDSLIIAISQSGETADTIDAVEKSQKRGVLTLSILNSPQSTLAHLSDVFYDLDLGKEIAVASTKAVTAQLAWGNFFLNKIYSQDKKILLDKIKNEQKTLAQFIDCCHQQVKTISSILLKENHCFVLGQDKLLPLAKEFALKLKEIAYLHAEALASSELKHGALALIQKNSLIIALIPSEKMAKKSCLNSLAEAKSRGAKIIAISTGNNELFDKTIIVPKLELLDDLSYIIPAQLLSYHLAIQKGHDPDRPRNLAKSVTVK
jgi:glucosamine--fructose-6-phosphate aminotransferase (isomerizing)